MNNFSTLLTDEGPLSLAMAGFEVRPAQQEMLASVVEAYETNAKALIEAGTGTGKSIAYLLPALLWAAHHGETTLISTHTISLQQQLLHKDIPFLLETLGLDLKVVLVKGMHNYLCLRKLHDAQLEQPLLSEREGTEVSKIALWAEKTREGSRSELPFVPQRETWERVCAEGDNCTHAKCPHFEQCFFFRARGASADAHVLIANHHLLFSDLAIRADSDNYEETCVLPPYERMILDEAHHLEDVATEYFAENVSRLGMLRLLGRLISERGTGKLKILHKKLVEKHPESELFDQIELEIPAEKRLLTKYIEEMFDAISRFHQGDEKFRFRNVHLTHPLWIEQVQPCAQGLIEQGTRFLASLLTLLVKVEGCEGTVAEIKGICQNLEKQISTLQTFIFEEEQETHVRWIEPKGRLVSAELDVSTRLSESLFERFPTVVCCSATLATGRRFEFMRKRLGIGEAIEKIYDSPFDFANQTQLLVPTDMPSPDSPEFLSAASEAILEIVHASRGNAFVLFTSYQMLKACAERIAPRLERITLLCQGEENRHDLLETFRGTDRSVLFGTDSFWEGVDVVGEALRCVVIVKLPFKVPTDPLFQARCEMIKEAGGSPFYDYSLPHAIVKFKQGFGRLIRNRSDRGCVICLDPRLIHKGYGKRFLRSLPPCPVHTVEKAQLGSRVRDAFRDLRRKVLVHGNGDGGV